MQAHLVDSILDDGEPGDYKFYASNNGSRGMLMKCPKCGNVIVMAFTGHGPRWAWDGNIESPTLAPSILHRAPNCGWHGYLVNGELTPV